MKICTNCGAQLSDEAVFCTECGTVCAVNQENEAQGTTVLDDSVSEGTSVLDENISEGTSVLDNGYSEGTSVLEQEAPASAYQQTQPQYQATANNQPQYTQPTPPVNNAPSPSTPVQNTYNPNTGAQPGYAAQPPVNQVYNQNPASGYAQPAYQQPVSAAPTKKKSKALPIILIAVGAVVLLIIIIAVIAAGSSGSSSSYSSSNYNYNSNSSGSSDSGSNTADEVGSILGTYSGNSYSNDFGKLYIKLPSGWEFVSANDRISNISNYEVDESTGTPYAVENGITTYYDMMMKHSDGASVQVLVMEGNANTLGSLSIADVKKQMVDGVEAGYKEQGYSITERIDSAGYLEINGMAYHYSTIKVSINGIIAQQDIAVAEPTANTAVILFVTADSSELESTPFKYFEMFQK